MWARVSIWCDATTSVSSDLEDKIFSTYTLVFFIKCESGKNFSYFSHYWIVLLILINQLRKTIYIYDLHHHHQVDLIAWIPVILSYHPSLSTITLGSSFSWLHPVCSPYLIWEIGSKWLYSCFLCLFYAASLFSFSRTFFCQCTYKVQLVYP